MNKNIQTQPSDFIASCKQCDAVNGTNNFENLPPHILKVLEGFQDIIEREFHIGYAAGYAEGLREGGSI